MAIPPFTNEQFLQVPLNSNEEMASSTPNYQKQLEALCSTIITVVKQTKEKNELLEKKITQLEKEIKDKDLSVLALIDQLKEKVAKLEAVNTLVREEKLEDRGFKRKRK